MFDASTGTEASILGSIEKEFIIVAIFDWLVLGNLMSELLFEDL